MLALAILLFGLLVVLIIAAVTLPILGLLPLLAWVIPAIPGLLMVGTVMLTLLELPLILGGPDDRRTAKQDLTLFLPTILISGLLAWASAFIFWR